MRPLIWKLVLPLTVISFAIFTKWWYVLPVDAPDTLMSGFPLPFVCPGWHTSLSLQIFVGEWIIDFGVYFLFWFLLIYGIDRFLIRVQLPKLVTIGLLSIAGLVLVGTTLIASIHEKLWYTKRPFEMQVMTTGYKFIWQELERPDFKQYDPRNTNQ